MFHMEGVLAFESCAEEEDHWGKGRIDTLEAF